MNSRIISGTFREDLEVGKIYQNAPMITYGKNYNVTFKVIREATEQEWREQHNYTGSLPIDSRIPRYFELEALD